LVGGTSASSPQVAGVVALANQARAAAHKAPIGDLNKAIYSQGFNQSAAFNDVASQTYGDGSVGVQISKAIGKLTVLNDITTYGSIGNSLVKGVNVQLPAVALSIKPGGEVQQIEIKGSVVTHGDKVISYEVNEGIVHDIRVEGAIIANGSDSIPISIENNGSSPVGHLRSRSAANS